MGPLLLVVGMEAGGSIAVGAELRFDEDLVAGAPRTVPPDDDECEEECFLLSDLLLLVLRLEPCLDTSK